MSSSFAKATAKVTFKNAGIKDYFKFIRKLSGKAVKVGILGANAQKAPAEYGGLTVAEVGAVHEFGSPKIGVPERAPIRKTLDKNDKKFGKVIKQGALEAIKDRKPIDGTLMVVGEMARAAIVAFIYSGKASPRNAPSTIDRKGSSVPLVDNGILVASYGYQIIHRDAES